MKFTRQALNLKKQKGITLVEVGIGLAIAAIIGAAAFMWFQDNTRKNQVKENTDTVVSIASGLKKSYGLSNQYAAVNTALAVQSRIIPEHLRNAGANTANNSYGGAITVAPVNLTGVADGATLTFANVPQSQCMDLVMSTEDIARRIRVNNVVVKATDAANVVQATLAANCEAADIVPVEWAIGRS